MTRMCLFYICLQVRAKYMNAIVRIEDGICLNVMIDGDVDLSHRLCQRARIGADQARVRVRIKAGRSQARAKLKSSNR